MFCLEKKNLLYPFILFAKKTFKFLITLIKIWLHTLYFHFQTPTCSSTCLFKFIYMYMNAQIYIYIYECTNIYIYTCIQVHSYWQINKCSLLVNLMLFICIWFRYWSVNIGKNKIGCQFLGKTNSAFFSDSFGCLSIGVVLWDFPVSKLILCPLLLSLSRLCLGSYIVEASWVELPCPWYLISLQKTISDKISVFRLFYSHHICIIENFSQNCTILKDNI